LVFANIKVGPLRKNGSCVITLKGVHAGDWIDFDGGEGGGPIDALARATGLSGRELFAYAAKLAGLTLSDPGSRAKPSAKARSSAKDASWEIDAILSPTVPIAGTLAEYYLKSRGLTASASSGLLFHAGLALRAAPATGDGRNRPKPIEPDRFMHMVSADGNARRTSKTPHDAGARGRWCGSSRRNRQRQRPRRRRGHRDSAQRHGCLPEPSGMGNAFCSRSRARRPPPEVQSVVLADHDASGTGLRAAEALAARLVAEERGVHIAMPPNEGDDFNDPQREGQAAISRRDAGQECPGDPAAPRSCEVGTNRPIGFAVGTTKRT
jgi:hypothetical protein